jgi:hypothetical protein
MTHEQFEYVSDKITESDFLKDSIDYDDSFRVPPRFKFATCSYVLDFGSSPGNYFKFPTDVPGLGQRTVEGWLEECTNGIMKVLDTEYLYNISSSV